MGFFIYGLDGIVIGYVLEESDAEQLSAESRQWLAKALEMLEKENAERLATQTPRQEPGSSESLDDS
jgi:RNase adaptor protein for sRNA GlmZ degradation